MSDVLACPGCGNVIEHADTFWIRCPDCGTRIQQQLGCC